MRTWCLLPILAACVCASAAAQQVNINFEAQCPNGVQFTGPCSTEFQFAGPQQTLNVPTSLGTVIFQGGVMLDDTTFETADETAVYSTDTGGGYSQAITITFPTAVTNLYLEVINGITQTESYTVSDNAGHSTSFSVPANTSSGIQGVGFNVAGTVITITTSDSNWDFSIDNLSFSPLAANPTLNATPGILNYSVLAGSSAPTQQAIFVANAGSGSLSFSASVVSGSPWVSVSPAAGIATLGSPVPVTVTVQPQALVTGAYRDVIQITSGFGTASVPVAVFAATPGPILSVAPNGLLFNVVAGAGSSATQTLNVLNIGSPNTNINFTAGPSNLSGLPTTNFISFVTQTGQAQPGNPGALTLGLNNVASSVVPGVYYELVQVADQNAQNSPQYVTAVLNVIPAAISGMPNPAQPQFTPAGLLFVGQVGRPIVSQQFNVDWSSTTPQVFQNTVSLPPGQTWLQADTGGSASTGNPATITVSVKPTGLSAGIYRGTISPTSATSGALLGAENVTLILANAAAPTLRQTGVAGCAPSSVVLTETGMPSNFTIPAGWPTSLIATMTDDCGNTIQGGSVDASFSNGDPPLSLTDQGAGGQYVATWQPTIPLNSKAANTVITLNGNSGALKPATTQLAGVVNEIQEPTLFNNGIVDDFSFLAGGAVAPATVAAAFGSNLSTSATGVSPPAPLPNSYQSTQLIVGGSLTPLYYVSPGQLNVEIPAEIRPQQQYPAVGVVNGTLSLPVNVTVVPVAPIVDATFDGTCTMCPVIAQDSNYALITSSHPAHPNEPVVIYLVGMGATNPAVATGKPAPGNNPGDSLAQATTQPVVKVGGVQAQLIYAGLSPGYVGLYQINFYVPPNVTAGNLALTVSQGSVNANSTTLPVAVP